LSEPETSTASHYRVKLIGVLASAAGNREIEIDGPIGISLSELVSKLTLGVNKRQFKDLLIDSASDSPLPNVIILVNDQDCNLFKGLKTELAPGSLVTIIPVAHGG
jgi:molybdopterin converting factor small subunit